MGARYIATGHTFNDQAETILFRMLRGTGLAGLTGIPFVRPLSGAVTLIRPLLAVRRHEVLAYLTALNQPFRTDSSNADLQYARNRLRHEILPALQKESSGDVSEQLVQLGEQAAELLAPIRMAADSLLASVVFFNSCVRVPAMLGGSDRLVLRELFVQIWKRQRWPRGEMNFSRWEELAQSLERGIDPAGMFPGGIRATWEGTELVISGPEA